MKYVIVRFDIEDAEMEQAHIEYSNEHNGRKAPSDKVAFARDLQAFAYDEGGMHGSFEVLHVVDGGKGCAGGNARRDGTA